MFKKIFNLLLVLSLFACGAGAASNNDNKKDKQLCEQKCKNQALYWIQTEPRIENYINTEKKLNNQYIEGTQDCNSRFPDYGREWTFCLMAVGKIYIEGQNLNLNNLDKFAPQELGKYNICVRACN